jgi:hypothetical protein
VPRVESLGLDPVTADCLLGAGFLVSGSANERSWAAEAAVVAVTAEGSLTGRFECVCFFVVSTSAASWWDAYAAVVAVAAEGNLTGLSECTGAFFTGSALVGLLCAADASVAAVAADGAFVDLAGDFGVEVGFAGDFVADDAVALGWSFLVLDFAGDLGVVGLWAEVVWVAFLEYSLPSAALLAESVTPCIFATPPRGFSPALVGVFGDFLGDLSDLAAVSIGCGLGLTAVLALSWIFFAASAVRTPIPLV